DAVGRALAVYADEEPETVRDLVRASGSVERLVDEIANVLSRLEEGGLGAEGLSLATRDLEELAVAMREAGHHARVLSFDARCAAPARAFAAAWRRVLGPAAPALDPAAGAGGAEEQGNIEELAAAAREFFALRRRGPGDAAQGFFDFRDER